MKVICVNYGHKSPFAEMTDYIKEGEIYTVRCEETGFSTYANRIVDAYGFEEIDGLYEKGMFMIISDFDENLLNLLRTKPIRKKENELTI